MQVRSSSALDDFTLGDVAVNFLHSSHLCPLCNMAMRLKRDLKQSLDLNRFANTAAAVKTQARYAIKFGNRIAEHD